MAHKAIWRCKQACISGKGCTLKAWSEEQPNGNYCPYGIMTPCWERYQAKKGQQRLNLYGGAGDE